MNSYFKSINNSFFYFKEHSLNVNLYTYSVTVSPRVFYTFPLYGLSNAYKSLKTRPTT